MAENRKTLLTTRQLTEIAILIALATIIEIAFMFMPRQPQGGSISLSLIPIVVLAYRHGLKLGLFAGAVFGLINWMLAGFPVYVHWGEIFLDYIFAYGVGGLAALVFRFNRETALYFALGAFVAGFARYFMHFFSGVVLFHVFSGDQHPVIFSLIYNGTYMVPTIILISIVSWFLFKYMGEQLQEGIE